MSTPRIRRDAPRSGPLQAQPDANLAPKSFPSLLLSHRFRLGPASAVLQRLPLAIIGRLCFSSCRCCYPPARHMHVEQPIQPSNVATSILSAPVAPEYSSLDCRLFPELSLPPSWLAILMATYNGLWHVPAPTIQPGFGILVWNCFAASWVTTAVIFPTMGLIQLGDKAWPQTRALRWGLIFLAMYG
jgi:hypothetical protein